METLEPRPKEPILSYEDALNAGLEFAGMTQEQLGDMSVVRWEPAPPPPPNPDVLKALAKMFAAKTAAKYAVANQFQIESAA